MIYDCFSFFNEFDILEIRLNTLKDVADKFVLLEATRTYQGKEKPLYYNENKARYKEFEDKIIHIILDEYPPYEGKSAWILERYQREMIKKGWANCKDDDIVLVSDVDEIPNPEVIKKYKDKPGVFLFREHAFYYYLNCLNVSQGGTYKWDGTVMSRFGYNLSPMDLRKISILHGGTAVERFLPRMYNKLRFLLLQLKYFRKVTCIQNSGWHFSYMGGVERIIKKIEAFAHTEYNKDEYKDPEKIVEALRTGKDIFGRNFHYKFVPIDSTFPEYILKNKEKYKHLIKE